MKRPKKAGMRDDAIIAVEERRFHALVRIKKERREAVDEAIAGLLLAQIDIEICRTRIAVEQAKPLPAKARGK